MFKIRATGSDGATATEGTVADRDTAERVARAAARLKGVDGADVLDENGNVVVGYQVQER